MIRRIYRMAAEERQPVGVSVTITMRWAGFRHVSVIEAGQVVLPHPSLFPWVDTVLDELTADGQAANVVNVMIQ